MPDDSPMSPNDWRALRYFGEQARMIENQGRYQEMLAGDGDAARQLYDSYTPLMRKDGLIDAPDEPIDTNSPRWNNTAAP